MRRVHRIYVSLDQKEISIKEKNIEGKEWLRGVHLFSPAVPEILAGLFSVSFVNNKGASTMSVWFLPPEHLMLLSNSSEAIKEEKKLSQKVLSCFYSFFKSQVKVH